LPTNPRQIRIYLTLEQVKQWAAGEDKFLQQQLDSTFTKICVQRGVLITRNLSPSPLKCWLHGYWLAWNGTTWRCPEIGCGVTLYDACEISQSAEALWRAEQASQRRLTLPGSGGSGNPGRRDDEPKCRPGDIAKQIPLGQ